MEKANKIFRFQTLSAILFVFILGLATYLLTNNALFELGAIERELKAIEYIPALIIFLFFNVLYISINKKKNGIKWNDKLIAILLFGLLINVFVIIGTKSVQTLTMVGVDGNYYDTVYRIDVYHKFVYCSQVFIVFLLMYYLFHFFPKQQGIKHFLNITFYAYLVALAILLLISYIQNGQNYISFLIHLQDGTSLEYPVGPFGMQKNVFGMMLFVGIIMSFYFAMNKHKKRWLFIALICFITMLFTDSKTSLICTALFGLAYFIREFIITYKQSKKRNLIILGSVLGAIVLIVLVFAIGVLTNQTWAKSILNGINQIFFEHGSSTMKTRSWIWNNILQILKQNSFIIGAGYGVFGDILLAFNQADPTARSINVAKHAHNMWLELLGNGGVILILLALILVGYFIYALVKIRKTHKDIFFFSLTLFIVSILYGLVENYSIVFTNNLMVLLILAMLYIPVFNALHFDKEKVEYELDEEIKVPLISRILYLTTPFIAVLSAGFFMYAVQSGKILWFILAIVLIVLWVAILAVIIFKKKIKISEIPCKFYILLLIITILMSILLFLLIKVTYVNFLMLIVVFVPLTYLIVFKYPTLRKKANIEGMFAHTNNINITND